MEIVKNHSDEASGKLIEIASAKYVRDYIIDIRFSDGARKVIDFEPFLLKSIHPSIAKYLDKNLFMKFVLEDGNLNWNDYDMIFPVADLHSGKVG